MKATYLLYEKIEKPHTEEDLRQLLKVVFNEEIKNYMTNDDNFLYRQRNIDPQDLKNIFIKFNSFVDNEMSHKRGSIGS